MMIPFNVSEIGDCAFGGCTSLSSIFVDPRNSYFESYDGLLINKVNKHLIQYPSGRKGSFTVPDFVTAIHYDTFYRCNDLTSVVIPESVADIGSNAFCYCPNLTTVSYLGAFDPGLSSSNIFHECGKVSFICVLSGHNSSEFCERNVTCKSSSCGVIPGLPNLCFDYTVHGDERLVHKTANATAWEDRTNGCVEYKCDPDSGMISWNKCKDSGG